MQKEKMRQTMNCKLGKAPPFPPVLPQPLQYRRVLFKILCCNKKSSSSSSSSPSNGNKFRFKLVSRSLGDSKWKLNHIDASSVKESLNQWLSKTQNFLLEVTSPLVKTVNDRRSIAQDDTQDVDDIFVSEQTVDRHTPRGDLSMPAVLSIEQFSRMNGMTGQKMQKVFKTLVPECIHDDARNLVEYCCFRFLSRDASEIHPHLKEPAFQRLIFVTMLAWEHPCSSSNDYSTEYLPKDSFKLKGRVVGEEAFVRIAPAISGVADWSTAHNLFKSLADNEHGGMSFTSWSTYINDVLRVHDRWKSYEFQEFPNISDERVLFIASGGKSPVLKWKNNMAWPGTLTLTDKALYFEGVGLKGKREVLRLGLNKDGCHVKKTRVGPLGFDLLDSAIAVSSGPESEAWVLEFIDLGGDMRRDVWYACINEVISLYKFIQGFGPNEDSDQRQSDKGNTKATIYATNAISRLQALQISGKLLDDPNQLVLFSYLQDSLPYSDVMLQTLAVNCWSQPLTEKEHQRSGSNETVETHVFDIDGSVYSCKWMRSPTWASNSSLSFWKSCSVKQGVIVFSKNLVVGDKNVMEKAGTVWREKCRVVERTRETINAAMIEGIPSNIALFKELMLPLVVMGKNFEKLRRWEDPLLTTSCLVLTYTLIFRDMLSIIFPATLMVLAGGMLLLKGLKEQGRLGRYFGKVTIRDQPPSNTIQKIIALKEALRELEKCLQSLNVSLLKLRSVVLAGQPQITMEVALVLLFGASILLIVPFRYILSFLIFDMFTRELEFRRQMVLRFESFLKERWDTVPASTVVVVPYEVDKSEGLAKERR
ncbi:unnamed protein product [Cuscuta europaea]|uniref:Uncharacterized protein n=1 Tax=Cuscuta europaea TaxID=41803 RepID=A0A9P0YIN7_CUSEU|nr:unnamed protein product [Cuscuta europaea]